MNIHTYTRTHTHTHQTTNINQTYMHAIFVCDLAQIYTTVDIHTRIHTHTYIHTYLQTIPGVQTILVCNLPQTCMSILTSRQNNRPARMPRHPMYLCMYVCMYVCHVFMSCMYVFNVAFVCNIYVFMCVCMYAMYVCHVFMCLTWHVYACV